MLGSAKPKTSDQVDQLAQATDIEARSYIVFRQHPSQTRVLYLDRIHSRVDELPNLRLLSLRLKELPSGLRWDPENPLGGVLVTRLQEVGGCVVRDPLFR